MYRTLKLTVTSPAVTPTEPLTVDQVSSYLNLPARVPPNEGEYSMIEDFIVAAREQAELLQEGRDLVPRQWDLTLPAFENPIELRATVASIDLVRYRDSDGLYTTLVEGTDYIVDLDSGLVMPPYNEDWPSFTAWPSPSVVLIRYTTRVVVDDLHMASIRTGMKYLISAWFNNRLPFETGKDPIQEYPWSITKMLSSGSVPKVRSV